MADISLESLDLSSYSEKELLQTYTFLYPQWYMMQNVDTVENMQIPISTDMYSQMIHHLLQNIKQYIKEDAVSTLESEIKKQVDGQIMHAKAQAAAANAAQADAADKLGVNKGTVVPMKPKPDSDIN